MGTAAVISLIKELRYKDIEMKFDVSKLAIAAKVNQELDNIRSGKTEDVHGWMFKI
jgi:hypothetical protein